MPDKEISLNRIYQGRATALEIESITETLSPKGKPVKTTGWAPALNAAALLLLFADFNELFQDAINYYLVALIGMATDKDTPAGRVRAQIIEGKADAVWEFFRRRGVNRPGLRESVAKYLGFPAGSKPTFDDAVSKIFVGNPATEEIRNAALKRLLEACKGDGAIQQNGRTYWPLFCDPKSDANSPDDPLALRRDYHQELMPFILHHTPDLSPESVALREFDIYSVAKPAKQSGKIVKMSAGKALKLFADAIENCFKDDKETASRLKALSEKTDWTDRIPDYTGGSVNKEALLLRFHAWVIFDFLEKSAVTLAKLRTVFPAPKKTTKPEAIENSGDPISELRGARGFAFPAFTKIVGLDWGSNNFDIAAFKEALKSLNQIQNKGEERETAKKELIRIQDYQTNANGVWKSGDEDSDEAHPPKLAGDPRIARLESLLTGDLAAAYEATEGESVEYGLRPRTIRGFDTLAKHWNGILFKHSGSEAELRKKLKEKLSELQTAESETIGSVVLFEKLIEPENRIIWATPDTETLSRWRMDAGIPDEAEFEDNPLAALTDHRERQRKIEELSRPIRLTPAHPVYSPRQIDLTEIGPKSPHEPTQDGRLRLVTDIAVRSDSGKWEKKHVRITYAAPRLLRDGLRKTTGETALDKVAWSQPMLTALGFADSAPQNFKDCAVMFMPAVQEGKQAGALLNFPQKLEVGPIIDKLGTSARWQGMFSVGMDKQPTWLHWPSSLDPRKIPGAWWTLKKPFRVLAEDLGTRDAGAFAIFEIIPVAPKETPPEHSRFLGEAGELRWYARRIASGLHRLPGEDAEVIRDGKRAPEFSGEKGRSATREESEASRSFLTAIGISDEQVAGLLGAELADTRRMSFPEQNDALLRGFRRAQGRLARYQSWSALEHPETKPDRRKRILEEIRETDLLDEELKAKFAAGSTSAGTAALKSSAETLRSALKQKLVELAERILPQRDFRWEWVAHPDNPESHMLRLVPRSEPPAKMPLVYGQRGLSCERLEQLENLRHRAQSLNRALTHKLGAPASFGRATRGDELPDPCPDILRKLDAMKENRVKQTAHLIIADALGLRLKAHSDESRSDRETRDIHGEYEKIPGREPVDFIALEDLNRYLADQGRSRAENSRLMQWSHREIVNRVRQLAEPFGIPVLTTAAAYTSRFCSRTGAPGFRAVALHPDSRYEFPWNKDLAKLAHHRDGSAKIGDKDELERLEHIGGLFDRLDEINRDEIARCMAARKAGEKIRPRWKTLVAPKNGGPLFIAIPRNEERAAAPVQADINAATNIGLRALAAPDNAEIHVRIRAQRSGQKPAGKPGRKKTAVSESDSASPISGGFAVRQGNKSEQARWKNANDTAIRFTDPATKPPTETFLNFFHDPGSIAVFEKARIGDLPVATNKALFAAVKKAAWPTCEKLTLRITHDNDDVSY